MNIKKIIKEEIDDFGWVKDIKPYELKSEEDIIKAFEGTEFNVSIGTVAGLNSALINDSNGDNYSVLYLTQDEWDWKYRLNLDIESSINICGDCELTKKYKKIYKIFMDYFFKDGITKSSRIYESEELDSEWDWVRNITPLEPYRISSEPNLYIDDSVVQALEGILPDTRAGQKEKRLGDFTWTSGGMRYKFTATLYPITYANGKKMWRVIGNSGDHGFGYSWITKRNTLGKRARTQIFKQIIDRYNLDNFVYEY